jgi:hypothetical protein
MLTRLARLRKRVRAGPQVRTYARTNCATTATPLTIEAPFFQVIPHLLRSMVASAFKVTWGGTCANGDELDRLRPTPDAQLSVDLEGAVGGRNGLGGGEGERRVVAHVEELRAAKVLVAPLVPGVDRSRINDELTRDGALIADGHGAVGR